MWLRASTFISADDMKSLQVTNIVNKHLYLGGLVTYRDFLGKSRHISEYCVEVINVNMAPNPSGNLDAPRS